MTDHAVTVRCHYERVWGTSTELPPLTEGPIDDLGPTFRVLEFRPRKRRRVWTYASCGLLSPLANHQIELHILSKRRNKGLAELLTAVGYYHVTTAELGLGHLVNFGQPWQKGASCSRGLISLPYLDGPALEGCYDEDERLIALCLWLIPIHDIERDFALAEGIDALEDAFERTNFDYADPKRPPVVHLR